MTEEEEKKVTELYNGGNSLDNTARLSGIGRTRVHKFLKDRGMMRDRIAVLKSLTPTLNENEIVAAYLEGRTLIQTSRKFKTQDRKIREILIRHGVLRQRGEMCERRQEEGVNNEA